MKKLSIVSCEPLGKHQTLNLHIRGDNHNFILASGVVSGNSHSYAYSLLSYYTAYLKANYPTEFMCCLMTMEDSPEETYKNILECRNLGIEVIPPDINESETGFTVLGDKKLRFGLGAIKSLGEKSIEKIINERKNAHYSSLMDFYVRTRVNSRVLENLIKAGAFDSFGNNRSSLTKHFDDIEKFLHFQGLKTTQKKVASGELTLSAPIPPDVSDWPLADKLKYEKEMLGFYLSGHPLDLYKDFLGQTEDLVDIESLAGEGEAKVVGVINNPERKNTKKGERYITFIFEDKTSSILCIAWPEIVKRYESLLIANEPVLLCGSYNVYESERQFIVKKIELLDEVKYGTGDIALSTKIENLQEIRDTIRDYPGKTSVELVLTGDQKKITVKLLETVGLRSEALVKLRNLGTLINRPESQN